MTPLVDVSQAARELFDEVRKLWHYASRGTPDGYWFERSERGRMLMRSMEHIVATRLTAEQANAAEIERLETERADLWRKHRDISGSCDVLKAANATLRAEIAKRDALLRSMLNAGWSHHIPEEVRGEMDDLLNKDASHG